jgi:hypothetical protein
MLWIGVGLRRYAAEAKLPAVNMKKNISREESHPLRAAALNKKAWIP